MRIKYVVLRVFLYFIFFTCLLFYALLQGSPYDWMASSVVAPLPQDVPVMPLEDDSDNRKTFRGLLVFIAIISQAFIGLALSRKEAISTVVLLCLVLFFFW
ncbi:hypothetical protein [Pseudomonas viridiflava]|uniref:hypothetical protein n=1 Tax=Pseudomonas viridiflava TaxID=33069 RepID=UPI000C073487|nr:hypothetical protein [Pseudomonas viridiflava]MEE4621802.1 hypothetical protein [Pseudomonas alliivorans]PHN62935.1 hypothetical protein AO275_05600 [Pseudomonas viridiflava]